MASLRTRTTVTIEPSGAVSVETTSTADAGAAAPADAPPAITVPPAYSLNDPPKVFGYGTAGFREKADILAPVVYRVGIVSTLRSMQLGKKIGLMITASHNPEPDNGVKIVDPMGEMLQASWEAHATTLANCSDHDLTPAIAKIMAAEGIAVDAAASVVIARDTRPSGPALLAAAVAGVDAVRRGAALDCGVLTTPQLHYIVRCHNDGSYGVPTEAGYVAKLAAAFEALCPQRDAAIKVRVDCANGVGAPKFAALAAALPGHIEALVYNDGSGGRLNEGCGADHVKTNQTAPAGFPLEPGELCASFDGDADRLMFFFKDAGGGITILDGDRIAILCALFLNERLAAAKLNEAIKLGVVQTAYANGGSTRHLNRLGIPVACAKTGVKHLHHLALQYDVGVYFEANGHGTVLFSDPALAAIKAAHAGLRADDVSRAATAVRDLQAAVDLINQTVGDAMSDLLLVLAVLAKSKMGAPEWAALYDDLPNRLLKVKIKDRSVVKTANAERTCTAPEAVQPAIDAAVARFAAARSFVRPSGTEDVVRVYAEAATPDQAVGLSSAVCKIVYDLCDGVGEPPAAAQFVDEIDPMTVHSLSIIDNEVKALGEELKPYLAQAGGGAALPLPIANKLALQSRLTTRLKTQQLLVADGGQGGPVRRTLSRPKKSLYQAAIADELAGFTVRLERCQPGSPAERQMKNYVAWATEEVALLDALPAATPP